MSCKTNAYPMEDGSIPQADEENLKMSDDDEPMSWYKPIAVILKPATEKDLRERLNPSTRTTVNHPQPQATSFQQHLPWAYPSPWTPYFFRRNDDVQQQNNWFRNVDECNVDWQSNQRVSYMIGPAKSTTTLYIQRDPYCRHTIIVKISKNLHNFSLYIAKHSSH